jgi:protein-S-isoprenylcysteine O-methyltransferase Ste14
VLASVALPVLVYTVGLPLFGLHLDRTHGALPSIPGAVRWAGLPLMLIGSIMAVWSALLLVAQGRGTPNPFRPPRDLVTSGPYHRSRNPIMLGGWIFGTGLALVLGSPSLLGIYAVVVLAGVVYVCHLEEPRLMARFGDAYRRYAAQVPRWFLILVALSTVAEVAQAQGPSPPTARPAVVVQIDVVPGGTDTWIELFETYMAPAIRDAIQAGDQLTDFEYFEALVPSQSTDVVLILKAESFGFFDQRRPTPHYRALFRRHGAEEGGRVLREMTALERSVEVTLLRSLPGTKGGP